MAALYYTVMLRHIKSQLMLILIIAVLNDFYVVN